MTTTPNYTINAVKTFIGRNGPGFNCTLLLDGKRVAFVYDDASGGMTRFNWTGETRAERAEQERALTEFCATREPRHAFQWEYDLSPDVFVSSLVDDYTINRWLLRKLKNGVLFEVGGKIKTIKGFKPTPAVLAEVARRHPGAIILNNLPVADACARYRATIC